MEQGAGIDCKDKPTPPLIFNNSKNSSTLSSWTLSIPSEAYGSEACGCCGS